MTISIKDILKELLAERTRLLLTILAVAWGTIAIAGMLAVGEGLRVAFHQAMSGVGKGLLFVQPGQTKEPVKGIGSHLDIRFNGYDYQSIKGLPIVQAIYPEFSIQKTLRRQDKTCNTSLVGVSPEYGRIRHILPQSGGRFIDDLDIKAFNRVIVLGSEAAHTLFDTTENPIGQSIWVDNIPFTIVGIMQDKLQLFSLGMPDKYLAWIPESTFTQIASTTTIPTLLIVPRNQHSMEALKQQILTLIALNHQVNPTDIEIVNFTDSAEIQSKTDTIFLGMQIFLGLIGILTLIVAGAGIANVMYASVSRSTRDIGIRMALGARSKQILAHYITESLFATAMGGLIGLLGTVVLIQGVSQLILLQNAFIFRELGYPQPILSLKVIIIVILTLGAIGLLAGFFPARKAALINPVEALRHE